MEKFTEREITVLKRGLFAMEINWGVTKEEAIENIVIFDKLNAMKEDLKKSDTFIQFEYSGNNLIL